MRPSVGLALLCFLYSIGLGVDLFASEWPLPVRGVVLLLGVTSSFVVYYSQFYQPTLRLQEEQLRLILPDLFDALVRKYREQHPGDYGLRVNVMQIRRRLFVRGQDGRVLFASFALRIDYTLGAYSEAELEQEYRPGVGSSGVSLERNQIVVFDAVEAQAPQLGLSATHREVTQHVHSILSIPIRRPGESAGRRPIGVLNLDSQDPIAANGFGDARLRELVEHYASLVGAALP